MLSIKNITKAFGDIFALEDISFDVHEGEFVFICGPSGAGKTTLIRLILREILPDKGKIIFEDKNIFELKNKEIPYLRQKIGVVFQDFKVMPERTLRENVELALAVCNLPSSEWKERVNHVLELVGLLERSELFPSQLSGGELQRASLARALVVNPKVILADEPTGNLDWDTAEQLIELFKKINEEGKTILMATHHKLIVDKLGRRVIQLKDGRVVNGQEGKEDEDGKDVKMNKKSKKSIKDKIKGKLELKKEKNKVRVKVEEVG